MPPIQHDRLREVVGVTATAAPMLHSVADFAHTSLLALVSRTPIDDSLWRRLGSTYTAHRAFIIVGALLFARAPLRARALPAIRLSLFGTDLPVNAALALLPAPDILQTLGTALRNAGLVGMGDAFLRDGVERAASAIGHERVLGVRWGQSQTLGSESCEVISR